MKFKHPSRKRVLRWIVILVVAAILGLYLVLPAAFGVIAVLPYQESVGAPPDGFEAVTLETDDGVTLDAWYAPPSNGAVIILLHGAGGSREGLRGYADMLVQRGYGVLALDARGHGTSGGTTNRLGWHGTSDVGAAVAFLQDHEEVTAMGALGLSMGGEILLGAASAYPEIRAIVADGATQRCLDELKALESERPLYRNFTARVFFATVQLLSGDNPPTPPLLESMVAADSTTFLLIAAGTNEEEIDYNELFADTVGERVSLWIAPDVSHTKAFKRYPDEYANRVIAFFDGILGNSKR